MAANRGPESFTLFSFVDRSDSRWSEAEEVKELLGSSFLYFLGSKASPNISFRLSDHREGVSRVQVLGAP